MTIFIVYSQWVKKREGFILVYSVDSKQSLLRLDELYDLLCHYVPDGIERPPIIVVANKTDLSSSVWQATPSAGEAFAKRIGADRFLETSALTGHNVEELYFTIIRLMRERLGEGSSAAGGNKSIQKEKKKEKGGICTLL